MNHPDYYVQYGYNLRGAVKRTLHYCWRYHHWPEDTALHYVLVRMLGLHSPYSLCPKV